MTGYKWDEVMKKADKLFEELIKEKYSGQDIAHIGLRLTHFGNYALTKEANKYLKNREEVERCK